MDGSIPPKGGLGLAQGTCEPLEPTVGSPASEIKRAHHMSLSEGKFSFFCGSDLLALRQPPRGSSPIATNCLAIVYGSKGRKAIVLEPMKMKDKEAFAALYSKKRGGKD